MKSAYELVMERLSKQASIKLTDEQKKQIAELDSRYAAKIAEREITLKGEIAKATAEDNFDEAQKLEQRLVEERKALQAELEGKKEQVRQAGRTK
jgi:hypothetical protein